MKLHVMTSTGLDARLHHGRIGRNSVKRDERLLSTGSANQSNSFAAVDVSSSDHLGVQVYRDREGLLRC